MRVLVPTSDLSELSDLATPSVFLVGPTPRRASVISWRPEAIELLRQLDFTGDVLAPEPFVGSFLAQVEWEHLALEKCTWICAWVPRDLETLPGFTTNVEFGHYVKSGRFLYGRPPGAPGTDYLDWLYHKCTGRQPFDDLAKLLAATCG